jgi:hypothetical protein
MVIPGRSSNPTARQRELNMTESIFPVTGLLSSVGLLDKDWRNLKELASTICGSGTAKSGSLCRHNPVKIGERAREDDPL